MFIRLLASGVLVLSASCGADESVREGGETGPAHCNLPTVGSLERARPEAGEWWKPGPMAVATTVAWPVCPPLDESTADSSDPPRITFPASDGEVAEGSWPVILFAHANSVSVCNPTDRYRSLHDQWASWGWIVYSVDSSDWNCTDFARNNIKGRMDDMTDALDDLRERNSNPDSPFFGRVDVHRVVVVGHSRGGTAVHLMAHENGAVDGAIILQAVNPTRSGHGVLLPAIWIDHFDSKSELPDPIADVSDDGESETDERLEDPEVNDLGGATICEALSVCEESWGWAPGTEDKPPRAYDFVGVLHLAADDGPGRYTTYLSEDRTAVEVDASWSVNARVRTPDEDDAPDFDVVIMTASGETKIPKDEATGPLGVGVPFGQLVAKLPDPNIVAVGFELRAGVLLVDDLRLSAP